MMAFDLGCVIAVGPRDDHLAGARDLLESLWAHESAAMLILLIANRTDDRGLRDLPRPPANASIVVLPSLPVTHYGDAWAQHGGLCCDILRACRVLGDRMDLEFVLKLDTDALVIAPFLAPLRRVLRAHPTAGLVGTLGRTCRREAHDYGCERRLPSHLLRLTRRLAATPVGTHAAGVGVVTAALREGFLTVREHVARAVAHGYAWTEYVQGGAYAIAPALIRRMAERGYLDWPEKWIPVPAAEDVVLGMYARAAGLDVIDASAPGEPFGTQWRGLAYAPERLVAHGYALIHSVTSDPVHAEADVRAFFRRARDDRERPRTEGAWISS